MIAVIASLTMWPALQAQVHDELRDAAARRDAAEQAAIEEWGEDVLASDPQCAGEVCTVVIVDDDECGLCVVSQDSVSC